MLLSNAEYRLVEKCSTIVLNHIIFVCDLYFRHRKSFRLSGRIMGTLPYICNFFNHGVTLGDLMGFATAVKYNILSLLYLLGPE